VNISKIRLRHFFLPIVILSFSLSVIITSCTSNNQNQSQTPNTDNTKVLKLLYWQAPTILNPHLSTGFKDSEASRIVLEPLATFNNKGELLPVLASEIPSIENGGVAKDGLSVTWKLKPDLKWSDGTPFSAKDVVFTYEFISNSEVGSVSAGDYSVVKKVEAIDDYTVKVNFQKVTPGWYLVFVGSSGMILPQHLYADFNGANAREAPYNLLPVGTGAYQVTQFKPGDSVIYERNPNYREPTKINFDKIELKGGGDATSAARAVLQTGDADYAYNLQVETQILNQLKTAGKGKIIANFGAQSERILLNQTNPNKETKEGERSSLEFPHPFFTDAKVRQALALAIEKNTIATQLYGDTGKPTSNFLIAPPDLASPNTNSEYDPKKAANLLDEAGWEDTNNDGIRDKDGVEMKVIFQTSVNPLRQKTQEIIKQSLQSIGISVELKTIDASIFFSSDPSNNDTVEHFYADMQMYTTGNLNPDPNAYMKTFTCDTIPQKKNNWSGDNYSRYCNPDYDKLWQKSTTELDVNKRRQMFIEMNDILVNNAVVIPLIHRAEVVGVTNNLQGLDLTPWDMSTWNIVEWQKTN
jgi:peptide/nickel transport system substrate-binding protein